MSAHTGTLFAFISAMEPGARGRRAGSNFKFVTKMFMPYGRWTLRDGTDVLFNRRYEPIWKRINGHVTPADPREWVEGIVGQEWYYKDATPFPARRKLAGAVLREWGLIDAAAARSRA